MVGIGDACASFLVEGSLKILAIRSRGNVKEIGVGPKLDIGYFEQSVFHLQKPRARTTSTRSPGALWGIRT